jgi:exonuclease SbcC
MKIKAIKMHNFMRFGEENNVLNFEEVFSGDDHIALIQGVVDGDENESNGAGKSTVFEAISYVFYERVPRLTIGNDKTGPATWDIIRTNDDNEYAALEAFVSIIFDDDDGNEYMIKRGRKLNKAKTSTTAILELLKNGEPMSALTKQRPEDDIANLIGIDYSSFVNSVMFAQKDTSKFLRGTNKGRKDILINLLGLEIIDALLKVTRAKKTACNSKLDTERTKLDLFKERIKKANIDLLNQKLVENGKKIEETEKAIKEAEAKRNILLSNKVDDELEKKKKAVFDLGHERDALEKQMLADTSHLVHQEKECEERLANAVQQQSSMSSKISNLETEMGDAKKSMGEIDCKSLTDLYKRIEKAEGARPNLVKKVEETRGEESQMRTDVAEASTLVMINSEEIQKIEKLISLEKDGSIKCPTCLADATVDHITSQHLAPLISKRGELEKSLSSLMEQYAAKTKELESAEKTLSETDKLIKKKSDVLLSSQRYKTLKAKIEKAEEEKGELLSSFEKHAADLKEMEGKLAKLKEDIAEGKKSYDEEMAHVKRKILVANKELEAQEEKSEELSRKAFEIINLVGIHETTKSSYLQDKAALETKIKSAEEDIDSAKPIEKNVGDTEALRKRILYLESLLGLNGIKSIIVDQAIPDLNKFVNEYLSILKNGMVVEFVNGEKGLDIEIRGGSASKFEMLSGGEQDTVRLATDMALGMVSIGLNKSVPNVLFLDEIFGALDPKTEDSIFKLLNRLSQYFENILVITHDPVLKDRFKKVIVVEKNNGISSFRISK